MYIYYIIYIIYNNIEKKSSFTNTQSKYFILTKGGKTGIRQKYKKS